MYLFNSTQSERKQFKQKVNEDFTNMQLDVKWTQMSEPSLRKKEKQTRVLYRRGSILSSPGGVQNGLLPLSLPVNT